MRTPIPNLGFIVQRNTRGHRQKSPMRTARAPIDVFVLVKNGRSFGSLRFGRSFGSLRFGRSFVALRCEERPHFFDVLSGLVEHHEAHVRR